MTMPNSRVIEKLSAADQEMLNVLYAARSEFEHHGDRGYAVEASVREFLRRYTRKDVGTGEIIDTRGNSSGQTDVVIVGPNHPFTFKEDSPGLFMIEGVLAAGEVKSVLTRQMLVGSKQEIGIIEKSRTFKRLTAMRPLGTSNTAYEFYDGDIAYNIHPPYFLIAMESKLSLEDIMNLILTYQEKEDRSSTRILDAVFLLNKGWIINFAGLWPLPNFNYNEVSESDTAWPWRRNSTGTVLLHMLSWLSIVMPRDLRDAPLMYWYTDPFSNSQ